MTFNVVKFCDKYLRTVNMPGAIKMIKYKNKPLKISLPFWLTAKLLSLVFLVLNFSVEVVFESHVCSKFALSKDNRKRNNAFYYLSSSRQKDA